MGEQTSSTDPEHHPDAPLETSVLESLSNQTALAEAISFHTYLNVTDIAVGPATVMFSLTTSQPTTAAPTTAPQPDFTAARDTAGLTADSSDSAQVGLLVGGLVIFVLVVMTGGAMWMHRKQHAKNQEGGGPEAGGNDVPAIPPTDEVLYEEPYSSKAPGHQAPLPPSPPPP